MTLPMRLPTFKELLAAVVGAVLMAAAVYEIGPVAMLGLAAGALALLLLTRPALATGIAVAAIVLCQSDSDWGIPATAQLYEVLPGMKVTVAEALLLLALAAAALAATRRGRLLLPAPFTPALALLGAAIAFGAVTGMAAGSGADALLEARAFIPLLLVPFIVVNAVEPEDLPRAVTVVAVCACVLAFAGLAVVATGVGVAAPGSGGTLTFIEATPNFVMMLFLLSVLAALVGRVALPWQVLAAAPFVAAALTLSYRRSFWIATVAGALLVLLIGSGQAGRRILLPGLIVIALGGWFVLSSGVVNDLSGPVEERIQSLDPGKVKASEQDRYRLDERKNVLAELEDQPLTGLGLGVPWPARYPLSIENEGGRDYVHFAALYYWLKLGPLGVIAYVWVLTLGVFAAIKVWRQREGSLIGSGALGLAMALVGLMLCELTATFVGADHRAAAVVGALLGLLAIASANPPVTRPLR